MLLAFDLDKTLVTNDYELPAEIEQGIRAARHAGHTVSVLTGRPPLAAQAYLTQLDVHEYYSTNHGALVIGENNEVLHKCWIHADAVTGILNEYKDIPGLEFSCVVDDALYVKNPDDERWAWAHTINRRVELFDSSLRLEADKIVFTANGYTKRIQEDIAKRYPEFILYPWDNGYLEISAANSDKGFALKLIAEKLGFEQHETVAFGDGPNDHSMLEWAGRGIAVGPHASEALRAIADEHIASPEELGVLRWLETNLL